MSIITGTTKYLELKENSSKENNLCIEIGYSLGGYNWYNGDNERRGYYLYCTPVEITPHSLNDGMAYNSISQILGKGAKILLKEVTRKSKKAETEAIELAKEKEQWLVKRVCNEYGLELK